MSWTDCFGSFDDRFRGAGTAGAAQEPVFRGILQSLTGPLCIGAIGTVGRLFVLVTGIAVFLRAGRIDA